MNILKNRKPRATTQRLPPSQGFSLPERFTEENPLIVDNSILSEFATCHTKAMIRYHHNLESNQDSHALLAGSATHKALEKFFRGASPIESLNIFGESYFTPGSALDPEEPFSWETTSETLKTWFAGHSLPSLPFEPLPSTVEGPLLAPLWKEKWGKRVLFLGLIDLVVRDKRSGVLSIMDNKTTGKRLDQNWVNQFRTSSQISGYIWLAQESGIHKALGDSLPISSALINTIQFSRLPQSERKCKTHSVPYSICKGLHATARLDGPFSRTPLQILQWLDEARNLTEQWIATREIFSSLENLRFVSKEGLFLYEACRFCPFTDFCSGLIDNSLKLPEFFRSKTWEPWKKGEAL